MRRLLLLIAAAAAMAALPVEAAAQGALAFTSNRCDGGGAPYTGSWPGFAERPCTPGIFVMDDDGSNQRRLTTGHSEGEEPRSGDSSPSWSPLGDRIVFSRQTTEAWGYERLFVMNANGSDQRRLIPDGVPGASAEQTPSWSRTGDMIAFQAYGPGIGFGSIWVVQPDGGGLRRVSPEGQIALSPAFAPDGVHIVYFGYRQDGSGPPGAPQDYGMWVTDRYGSPPRRVTAGDLRIASNGGSFSPSGRWMAVTIVVGENPQSGMQPLIYAMRTDGSELRRIEGAQGVTPTWSGLGNAIFYSDGEDAYTLRIYRLDLQPGAKPRALTEPGAGFGRAEWSAAGRITTALPPLDELAPLTIVGDLPGAGEVPGKLPLFAADVSGLERIDAAVGLRAAGRCRFLRADGRLGPRRSCSAPVYARAPLDAAGWRKRTRKLPKGTYEVRLKATDGRGNTTRKPKRRVVAVD